MLTINTNLSSLIVQSNLNQSTNALNRAIERMTTGFKINHAKDNAANYSISTNMTTKIGAYRVAEDNVSTGIDLVTTAADTISLMQNRASRLAALSTQARNGTYGDQSIEAINNEANAIAAELSRLYTTAEFNGVKLFGNSGAGASGSSDSVDMPTARADGFIVNPKTYTDAQVNAMEKVRNVTAFESGHTYSISNAEEFQKFANLVNARNTGEGATFVLGDDIDLSSVANWERIGTYNENSFRGTLDGNGHVIKNLKINKNTSCQGLFGTIRNNAAIKNLGLENVNVNAMIGVGSLVGLVELDAGEKVTIDNCYVSGKVEASMGYDGGLVGQVKGVDSSELLITNCYSLANVKGVDYVGGLVGNSQRTNIRNCYSEANVIAQNAYAGGLVGYLHKGTITRCYSTEDVHGIDLLGGLAGNLYIGSITDSYATGNVYSSGLHDIGGLVGETNQCDVKNCYATGDVIGAAYVGGLIGYHYSGKIIDCYATGNVTGNSTWIGGLVGYINYAESVTGSSAYGTVSGVDASKTGSFIGTVGSEFSISDCGALEQGMEMIGSATSAGIDLSAMRAGINVVTTPPVTPGIPGIMSLQVGINSSASSVIEFSTSFAYDFNGLLRNGIESVDTYDKINDLLNILNTKSTELGAVENRLESVLEDISTHYDNLVSSRSTLRDADIAKESSAFIKSQILQQASATLLATANQTPAIALQLL